MIDLYCERTAGGLLAEPLNLISNLAFLVAGVAAAREARRGASPTRLTMAVLVVLIGFGSALFHSFAQNWAQWTDVLPIIAFQLVYLEAYLQRTTTLGGRPRGLLVAAFLLATVVAGHRAELNGSVAYVPALAVLLLMAWRDRSDACAALSSAAVAFFALSLALRTLDAKWCAAWPSGTHFCWHLLNALVLWLLLGAQAQREAGAAHGSTPSFSGRSASRTHSDMEPS